MIVGLDMSLTSSGLARIDGTTVTSQRLRPRLKGHERLKLIADSVAEYSRGAELAVIEGISMASFDANKALAGMWWIVRHRLWEEGVPVGVMPPQTLKKYTTGSGSATKSAMIAAVQGDLFPFATADDDDEADAIALAHAGSRWLGRPLDRVTAIQQASVRRGIWPDSI